MNSQNTKTPEDELLAVLLDMVLDHCTDMKGTLDSWGRPAHTQAMRLLAKAKKSPVRTGVNSGRKQISETEPDGLAPPGSLANREGGKTRLSHALFWLLYASVTRHALQVSRHLGLSDRAFSWARQLDTIWEYESAIAATSQNRIIPAAIWKWGPGAGQWPSGR